jgi:hypothetical protein
MPSAKKPKGAYSKVGGVGGVKFTGKTPEEKFENYITGIRDTSETRKDRFEDTSRLYAAARKLGLSEKSVKSQIDTLAKEKAKYGASAEKKASKADMEDMMRRSAENAKSKVKKSAAAKKPDPSNTKPFNVRLIKPAEIIKDKPKTPVRDKTADDARLRATERARMLRGESAEDKAYRLIMEKYNYDVTKIPGFKGGAGTR